MNPVEISETHFYCEFSDDHRNQLRAGILYLVVNKILNPDNEETQEIYALAYGYAGGNTEGDWLFKRDSYNYRWVYGDTSGDEWKGAKEKSKGGHLYDLDIDEIPPWTDQDSECYAKLMELRNNYFTEEEDELTSITSHAFDKYRQSESSACSDGFDMDVLYDISPIWNLTTQYLDPYYQN